ncbi:MAG: hypothetical protein HQL52_17160 [Magnetococcales bacterium]|nr:hypothetical protein [Magnetococcales bacterium]
MFDWLMYLFNHEIMVLLFVALILALGLRERIILRRHHLDFLERHLEEAFSQVRISSENADDFAGRFEEIDANLSDNPLLGSVWTSYRQTLIHAPEDARVMGSRKPDEFFNFTNLIERNLDVNHLRGVPTHLVGLGFILTVLGLMGTFNPATATLTAAFPWGAEALLTGFYGSVAFKFTCLVAGIFTAIHYALGARLGLRRLERLAGGFCRILDERVVRITGAQIANQQVTEIRKQNRHLEALTERLGGISVLPVGGAEGAGEEAGEKSGTRVGAEGALPALAPMPLNLEPLIEGMRENWQELASLNQSALNELRQELLTGLQSQSDVEVSLLSRIVEAIEHPSPQIPSDVEASLLTRIAEAVEQPAQSQSQSQTLNLDPLLKVIQEEGIRQSQEGEAQLARLLGGLSGRLQEAVGREVEVLQGLSTRLDQALSAPREDTELLRRIAAGVGQTPMVQVESGAGGEAAAVSLEPLIVAIRDEGERFARHGEALLERLLEGVSRRLEAGSRDELEILQGISTKLDLTLGQPRGETELLQRIFERLDQGLTQLESSSVEGDDSTVQGANALVDGSLVETLETGFSRVVAAQDEAITRSFGGLTDAVRELGVEGEGILQQLTQRLDDRMVVLGREDASVAGDPVAGAAGAGLAAGEGALTVSEGAFQPVVVAVKEAAGELIRAQEVVFREALRDAALSTGGSGGSETEQGQTLLLRISTQLDDILAAQENATPSEEALTPLMAAVEAAGEALVKSQEKALRDNLQAVTDTLKSGVGEEVALLEKISRQLATTVTLQEQTGEGTGQISLEPLLEAVREAGEEASRGHGESIRAALTQVAVEMKERLGEVAAVARDPRPVREIQPLPSEDSSGFLQLLEEWEATLEDALERVSDKLDQVSAVLGSRLAGLPEPVVWQGGDGEPQAVGERGIQAVEESGRGTQAVGEREIQTVVEASQSISGDVAQLTRSLTDRDGELLAASQSISGDVERLTRSLTDRDGELLAASQSISGDVERLTRSLTDRDGELVEALAALAHEVKLGRESEMVLLGKISAQLALHVPVTDEVGEERGSVTLEPLLDAVREAGEAASRGHGQAIETALRQVVTEMRSQLAGGGGSQPLVQLLEERENTLEKVLGRVSETLAEVSAAMVEGRSSAAASPVAPAAEDDAGLSEQTGQEMIRQMAQQQAALEQALASVAQEVQRSREGEMALLGQISAQLATSVPVSDARGESQGAITLEPLLEAVRQAGEAASQGHGESIRSALEQVAIDIRESLADRQERASVGQAPAAGTDDGMQAGAAALERVADQLGRSLTALEDQIVTLPTLESHLDGLRQEAGRLLQGHESALVEALGSVTREVQGVMSEEIALLDRISKRLAAALPVVGSAMEAQTQAGGVDAGTPEAKSGWSGNGLIPLEPLLEAARMGVQEMAQSHEAALRRALADVAGELGGASSEVAERLDRAAGEISTALEAGSSRWLQPKPDSSPGVMVDGPGMMVDELLHNLQQEMARLVAGQETGLRQVAGELAEKLQQALQKSVSEQADLLRTISRQLDASLEIIESREGAAALANLAVRVGEETPDGQKADDAGLSGFQEKALERLLRVVSNQLRAPLGGETESLRTTVRNLTQVIQEGAPLSDPRVAQGLVGLGDQIGRLEELFGYQAQELRALDEPFMLLAEFLEGNMADLERVYGLMLQVDGKLSRDPLAPPVKRSSKPVMTLVQDPREPNQQPVTPFPTPSPKPKPVEEESDISHEGRLPEEPPTRHLEPSPVGEHPSTPQEPSSVPGEAAPEGGDFSGEQAPPEPFMASELPGTDLADSFARPKPPAPKPQAPFIRPGEKRPDSSGEGEAEISQAVAKGTGHGFLPPVDGEGGWQLGPAVEFEQATRGFGEVLERFLTRRQAIPGREVAKQGRSGKKSRGAEKSSALATRNPNEVPDETNPYLDEQVDPAGILPGTGEKVKRQWPTGPKRDLGELLEGFKQKR